MKAWQIEFVRNDASWRLQVGADLFTEAVHSKEAEELLAKQVRLNTPEAEVKAQWEEFFTKKKLEKGA